ncbi:ornithine carbamoyltransferase-like isoform X3 [Colias croceus]|uniref:ornithine carbamoyltransferase-like isoform X3 n=1 Tax=Colias crocea TaxID=72248 RepID=UPI001E280F7A|nr:ornithine carbamoyltransferase-like isoform X3 [Colias croceus]
MLSSSSPRHMICFKDWNGDMVMDVINSALNLKCCLRDTHGKRLNILDNCKIMILQEVNEPVLNMAVSKAASLLGADAVNIVDKLMWENDYNGRVFSYMADAIFVATSTHTCLQRFAQQSSVPVMCMTSRTHASIQAMATFMTIIEEYGTLRRQNITYFGSPHPVLNTYLLLCPMLGANIKFKCCCDDINKHAGPQWIFLHTCPRGKEVDDHLFFHSNARTFPAFENFQYICTALMASAIKNHFF